MSAAAPAPFAEPARRPPSLPSPSLRWILAALGLAFVAWLLWDLGPAAVWSVVRALGWRVIVLLFVPYVVAVALDTVGWGVLLPAARVGWPALTGVRLAGEAVNLATPTASVGGEPLKAFLVRHRVPLDTALASIVVDKTTVVVGQTLLVAAGLALAAFALDTPRALRVAMAVLLGAELVGTGGFVLVQLRGGVAGAGRILQRLGVKAATRHQDLLGDVDRRLLDLYRGHGARVAVSALLHAGGWAVGALEIYAVLDLAGMPVGLATALVLEAVRRPCASPPS